MVKTADSVCVSHVGKATQYLAHMWKWQLMLFTILIMTYELRQEISLCALVYYYALACAERFWLLVQTILIYNVHC